MIQESTRATAAPDQCEHFYSFHLCTKCHRTRQEIKISAQPSPSTGGEIPRYKLVSGEHREWMAPDADGAWCKYDHHLVAMAKVDGGEPATDSAGLVPIYQYKSLVSPFHWIDCDQMQYEWHKQHGFDARIIAVITDAAREPVPVARELDVDTERLQRHGAHLFSTCKGLGWKDDGEGAVEFLMRTAYSTGKEDADRQATAESAPASAAPGEWISVEDERKPKGRTPILVAVSLVRFGEYEDGTPGEWPGEIVAEGEYVPQHGEVGNYFTCYSSPHGDQEGITHWMPLPAAPSNNSPVGAKESK